MKTIYILWGMLVLTALGINIYFSIEQNRLIAQNLKRINSHLSGEISATQNNLQDTESQFRDINKELSELKTLITANFSALKDNKQLDSVEKNVSSLERNILDIQSKVISIEVKVKDLKGDIDLISADTLFLRQQDFIKQLDPSKLKRE